MTWDTSDEKLWSESDAQADAMVKGSARLLDAHWREHPERMWQLAKMGRASVPSSLAGLRLRPPLPKADRFFHPDRNPPPIFYGNPDWVKHLIAAVAERFGITVDDIKGPRRVLRFVEARRMIAKALRDEGMSYPRIAFHLGRQDHSTAMNLVKGRARQHSTEGGEG